jgi:hypothetical protein
MNASAIPELTTQDEFHNWCLEKSVTQKLQAMLHNWEPLTGGPTQLKPQSFTYDKDRGSIVFLAQTKEQKQAVDGLKRFYKGSIDRSNLDYIAPANEEDPVIMFGRDHGYLTTILGLTEQMNHIFQ